MSDEANERRPHIPSESAGQLEKWNADEQTKSAGHRTAEVMKIGLANLDATDQRRFLHQKDRIERDDKYEIEC